MAWGAAAALSVCILLHAQEAAAYILTQTRQVECPMDYQVPMAGGKPSKLHLKSVANFLEPRVQDKWWNEKHVDDFYTPSDKYLIGRSKIAGCGVIAAHDLHAGERIGIVWVKDPASFKAKEWADLMPRHFTPWFGRAVNHCNHPNSRLEEDDQGTVYSVATQDIKQGDEVTGDYNEAAQQFPHLVMRAPDGWTC
mmetsp:Transcript_28469/g.90726  ORF Transcript_28469/g.90726 Transcript_28469/m.90726 type:complete len:195 (-) Transcript_28469:93-677(-)